ncbi:MAG TPA: FAD-dependent oxidoreductase [Candidatus Saccharimonadales bacterium]|nr:FAD-dependent oxidoreductase [Candidatus Saccharimonadales bacterium]
MEYLFPLIDRQEVAEGTMTFFFDTTGSDYTFKPGQHTDYTLIDPPQTDAEGNTRTFSFVNLPGEGKIQIATRMRDTAFKNSLKTIPLGTKVKVKEPMGRMTLHQDTSKSAVFLIGGIGITPVMSIIRSIKQSGDRRTFYLFYSNPSQAAAAFYDELKTLSEADKNFHFIPIFTDTPPANWQGETARIDAAMIKKHVKNPTQCVFYSSGPPAMVSAMINLAEELGLPEEQIKSEDFSGY